MEAVNPNDNKGFTEIMDQEIILYGTTWCGDCKRAMRLMNNLKVSYRYINIDQDETAAAYVLEANKGQRSVPTIVFPDGSLLVEPSNSVLTQKLVESNLVSS